jgi:hypothetical protein
MEVAFKPSSSSVSLFIAPPGLSPVSIKPVIKEKKPSGQILFLSANLKVFRYAAQS